MLDPHTPPYLSKKRSLLSARGEMSELMASKDWSKTLLGDIDLWPQSLLTATSIILNSKFPMFIFWGREQICLYNDAYRPSLGINGKHPNILGMPGEKAWPDIWHIIKPMLDGVMAGGEATWNEDQLIPIYRNGELEDVYWTFSYSPINDESGKPGGVFVTCMETTEKVFMLHNKDEKENELNTLIRKLEKSEEKFRNTVKQAPTGIAFFRGKDFVLEMANKNYLQLIDKEESAVVGKPMFEFVPEVEEIVRPLIENVLLTGIPYTDDELKVVLNRYGKAEEAYFNLVYQPFFEADGRVSGVMVVANEVTASVKSKLGLKVNEEKLRLAIEGTSLGTFEIDLLTNAIEYSDRYLEIYGFQPHEQPTRQEVIDRLYEEDKVIRLHSFEEALVSGMLEYEARVISTDTITKWIRVRGKIIYDNDNKPIKVLGTVIDITKEKNTLRLIEESEVRLRLALEGTRLATWDLDLQTRNILYSPRLLEIFGHDKTKILTHQEMRNQVHPDDIHAVVEKAFAEAEETGMYYYEARIIKPDKTISWIKTHGNMIFDNNKVPVRMIGTLSDITESKTIEESMAKMAAIVQSSGDAIIGKTTQGIITSWNDAAENIFGYAAEEMIGQSIYKLIPEDRVDEELLIMGKIKSGERLKHFETKRLRKDKTLIDLSITVSPIKDSNNNIIGASKIARDITSQKKTEKLITENQYRLNTAIEAAEMGTWELDMVTDEVQYSQRYLEILELDPSRHPTHDEIITVIYPDDLPLRNKMIKEAMEKGTLEMELRIITMQTKSIKWVKSRAKVFYDTNGKPLKMMGIILDITAEKMKAEELRTREEKFRLLANSMPQLVWTSDTEGNLNYFNQSVYSYSGITKKQMEEKGWIQIVHPEDRDENIKKWMQSVKTGKDFLFEHRFRKHNGEFRWQLSRAIPQKDPNGNIQMWVGTSTDIHEIKESEQQKDLFISMASHELKTPITSIKGYVQILLSMHNDSNDTFLKNSLFTVNKQIGVLTNLIGDLLDMSKIKSGSLQLNREAFNLNSMVKEIITDMEHTEPKHDFIFNAGKDVELSGDKERIGQVLINFLTNAIKYSPNSNIININSTIEDDYAIVSVADKGIGINKADQQKIFDRFYRVEGKDEKTFPGFGIGLFIASEIIQRHKGKIKVESEPGKGSIFSFLLPLEK
ncbi:MAG: PAS domain S-box protein [Bacteroidota bacterium]